VRINGSLKVFEVATGAEGELQFQRDLRRLLKLKEEDELNVKFTCRHPTGRALRGERPRRCSPELHCGR